MFKTLIKWFKATHRTQITQSNNTVNVDMCSKDIIKQQIVSGDNNNIQSGGNTIVIDNINGNIKINKKVFKSNCKNASIINSNGNIVINGKIRSLIVNGRFIELK